jgi:Ca2+-binding RTX toxin-like protein
MGSEMTKAATDTHRARPATRHGALRGTWRRRMASITAAACVAATATISTALAVPTGDPAMAAEGDTTFITIDGPGATRTVVTAMNDAGDVVGHYDDAEGRHGFLRSADGTFITIDGPGSTSTTANAINSAGDVVGSFLAGTDELGFLRANDGTITTFDDGLFDINDAGDVLGRDELGTFVRASDGTETRRDTFTVNPSLNDRGDVIGAQAGSRDFGNDGVVTFSASNLQTADGTVVPLGLPASNTTVASAINDAGAVGGSAITVTGLGGFIRDPDGTYEFFQAVPEIGNLTWLYAMNDVGDVGGFATFTTTKTVVLGNPIYPGSGYVRAADGSFTKIDGPGAVQTMVNTINNVGGVGGEYVDGTGTHGFVIVTETSCQPGTFSASGLQPCTVAPIGTYVDTSGATAPTDCPTGLTTPGEASTSADACETDGDGVPDSADNCIADINPDQVDFDADGIGDVCDPDDDGDGDGVNDDVDNCLLVANPDQANSDDDPDGDACDLDDDNDGEPDATDALPVDPTETRDDDPRFVDGAFVFDGVGNNSDPDNLLRWQQADLTAAGNWVVSSPTDPTRDYAVPALGHSNLVLQTSNGGPTVFHGPDEFYGSASVEATVQTTGDDDFFGFVLGFDSGDLVTPGAEFMLIDWKRSSQTNGVCPDATPAFAFNGTAVSRVAVVEPLDADSFWGHCGSVGLLARGSVRGATGWIVNRTYTFDIEYSPTRLRVSIDGILEFDLAAPADSPFPPGAFGFYNFSQDSVEYRSPSFASVTCPAGQFGAFDCTPAPAGTFADGVGALTPTPCPLGTYTDVVGQISCTPAPVDTYVDTEGASAPTNCPPNSTTDGTGSTSIDDCTPISTDGDGDGVDDAVDNCVTEPNADQLDTDTDGQGDACDDDDDGDLVLDIDDDFPIDGTRAVSCAPGSYGAFSCEPADAGSFVADAGALVQTACPIGRFSDQSGAVACTPAPAGSFVGTLGAIAPTPCTAGTYNDVSGATECVDAPLGTYVDTAGAIAPTDCPPYSTTTSTGSDSSDDCVLIDADGDGVPDVDDAFPDDPSRAVSCEPGSYGAFSCALADPGSFVATPGAVEQTRCSPGFFSATAGATECQAAPPGGFVPTAGATEAVECAPGSFSATFGQVSCDPAPAGTFVDAPGAASATPCALGFFNPDAGQGFCRIAPADTYVDVEGAIAATNCPADTFTTGTGSTSIDDCIAPDADDDGIADVDDNCVDTPNTDQSDADVDGIGDACDDTTPPTVTGELVPSTDGADWTNDADSQIVWSAIDAGFSLGPDTFTIEPTPIAEGITTYTSPEVCDDQGNCSTGELTVSADFTDPMISGAVASLPNAAGWWNTVIDVEFTCADALSGIATCPAATAVTDGVTQVVAGTATDVAGNTATSSVEDLNVDTVAPSIGASIAPSPNEAGWLQTAATVTFDCDDDTSGIATCPAPVEVTDEVAGQVVSGTAVDIADLTTTTTATINIDSTPPAVSLQSPSDGSSVPADAYTAPSCEASDDLSGLDGNCTLDVSSTPIQGGELITATAAATDVAGNTTTVSSIFIVVTDAGDPTIVATPDRPSNSNGWWNGPVTWTFECDDDGAGVATCPEPVSVNADGAGQSFEVTASDNVGNTAALTVAGINIDSVAPTVEFSGNEAAYTDVDTIDITCGATDSLSGIDAAECPELNIAALDYGFGVAVLTATATDAAGNTTTTSIEFDVTSPPTAVDDTETVDVDTTTEFDVIDNDLDAENDLDPTSLAVTSPPAIGSAVVTPDGTIEYTAGADAGQTSLTYSIADADGISSTATVTITITAAPSGACTITGTRRGEVIYGTPGDDIICARGGDDVIYGLGGNDIIKAGAGDDIVYGGDGDDTILGGRGNDEIHGDDGNDTLKGQAGSDYIEGGAGDDVITGHAGDDVLAGGADNDTLIGGRGADQLAGDGGDDTLKGGRDGDLLIGGDGNDELFGNGGIDLMFAGSGDDTVRGGGGFDVADGGSDVDACRAEIELSCEGSP